MMLATRYAISYPKEIPFWRSFRPTGRDFKGLFLFSPENFVYLCIERFMRSV